MPKETSAGAIIFRKNKERKYLLLLYKGKNFNYWEFARGNIEKYESEKETIIREIEEETGIKDLEFVKGFKDKINFYYRREGKIIYKEIRYVLARTKTKKINLSNEHLDSCWATYEEALTKLKFKNDKEILTKAENFLKKRENEKSRNS